MMNDEDKNPTDKELEPSRRQPNNNPCLSLLDRHYSTIGIDDVFLNAVGPSLLSLEDNKGDNNDDNDDNHDDATTTISSQQQWWLPSFYLTQQQQQQLLLLHLCKRKDPLVLWEMVGDIKTIPEDFIVREISPNNNHHQHPEIANLRDDDCVSVADPNENVEPLLPSFSNLSKRPSSSSSNKDNNNEPKNSSNDQIICESQQQGTDGCFTIMDASSTDPIESLKCILQNRLEKNSSTTTVEQIIKDLDHLNQRVLETLSLSKMATENNNDKNDEGSVQFVLEHYDDGETSAAASSQESSMAHKQQSKKKERGEIHEAMRFAYPLLKSEVVTTTESQTFYGGNNMEFSTSAYQIRIVPDPYFRNLAPYLLHPAVDLSLLYSYFKRGYEYAEQQQEKINSQRDGAVQHSTIGSKRCKQRGSQISHWQGVTLRLRPDVPKMERRNIHQIIEAKTKGMLGTRTIQNNSDANDDDNGNNISILVQWTKVAKRKVNKKRNRDALEDNNNVTPNQTYTLCVVRKRKVEHLSMIHTLPSNLRCRPCDISFAGIKDMNAVTYQFCTIQKVGFQRILRAQGRLEERGISIQPIRMVDRALRKGDLTGNRFQILVRNMRQVKIEHSSEKGVKETFVPANVIHIKAMVDRIQTSGFVNFYGEQRVGDPGSEMLVGVRAVDIGRAILQRDYSKAIDLILTGRRNCDKMDVETDDFQRFRQTWKDTKDPDTALKALPRGGLPRETAVLRGLKRYGSDNPQAVLQCLQYNDRIFYVNAYQSYVWNKMASKRVQHYGTCVVAGDLVSSINGDGIIIADKNNLADFQFQDVVLPIPGYSIEYPKNDVGKFYEDFLLEENVHLDKDAFDAAATKGAYRHLVAVPKNFKCDVKVVDNNAVDAEFQFDLNKGSYATMMLRELMLTTIHRRGNVS